MRKRFLLIHNPFAGVRGHALANRTARALERAGASVVVIRSRGPIAHQTYDDISKNVRISEFDAVLAAGGDGTIRALAAACGNSGVPVGIIPMGTGNVLAHEIGLTRRPNEIADVAMNGPVQEVFGASVNDEFFFLMAGIGFDGEVISNLNLNTKRRLAKIAYTGPIVRALAKQPVVFSARIDGKEYRASWLVTTNASHYAGGFTIAPEARITRPGLTAVVFKAQSRWERIRELLALAMGRLHACKTVSIMPCNEVTVSDSDINPTGGDSLNIEADGDALGHTPANIRAGEIRLNLIVPPKFAQRVARNDTK